MEEDNCQLLAKRNFNYSNEYLEAAIELIENNSDLHNPIYFLLTHCIELLLKSYINTQEYYSKRTHDLDTLVKKCKRLELELPHDAEQISRLIQTENKKHGFRYYLYESTTIPSVDYYLDFVKRLKLLVEINVLKIPETIGNESALIKVSFGKPTLK